MYRGTKLKQRIDEEVTQQLYVLTYVSESLKQGEVAQQPYVVLSNESEREAKNRMAARGRVSFEQE